MDTLTNEELLRKFQTENANEAFDALDRRLRQKLYYLALRILRSPEDAEDIVQDCLFKLMTIDLEKTESLESLAYRITQNLAFIRLRRNKIRETKSLDVLPIRERAWEPCESNAEFIDQESPIPFRPGMSTEEWLLNDERYARIEAALKELSPNRRNAIVQRFLNGIERKDVESMLGMNQETFEQYLDNAIRQLRKLVGDTNETETIHEDGDQTPPMLTLWPDGVPPVADLCGRECIPSHLQSV